LESEVKPRGGGADQKKQGCNVPRGGRVQVRGMLQNRGKSEKIKTQEKKKKKKGPDRFGKHP